MQKRARRTAFRPENGFTLPLLGLNHALNLDS